jgi:hypothetical protein
MESNLGYNISSRTELLKNKRDIRWFSGTSQNAIMCQKPLPKIHQHNKKVYQKEWRLGRLFCHSLKLQARSKVEQKNYSGEFHQNFFFVSNFNKNNESVATSREIVEYTDCVPTTSGTRGYLRFGLSSSETIFGRRKNND